MDYDIAIVGGGVVGMVAARCFALNGLRVAVFEKSDMQYGEQKQATHPVSLRRENMTFLKALGVEVEACVRATLKQVKCSSKGYFGVLPLQLATGGPLADVVSMADLQLHLHEVVQKDTKITVIPGVAVDGIEDHGDYMMCTAGQRQWSVLRCVICDGAKSPLAERMQVPKKRHSSLLQSTVIPVCAEHWPQEEALIRQDHHTIYGAIPGAYGRGWVIATAPVTPNTFAQYQEADWQKQIEEVFASRLGHLTIDGQIMTWRSVLQSRALSPRPGMFLLGNAALSTPPIGAQGLNLALQDCSDLWRLQKNHCWVSASAVWQDQLQSLCAPRHQRWYEAMALVLDQLKNHGPRARLKERILWAWWGMDSQWQVYVRSAGLGR